MQLVKINVSNTVCIIEGHIDPATLSKIQEVCSYEIQGQHFMKKGGKCGKWDGRKHLFNINTKSFPTGILDIVSGLLTRYEYKYEYVFQYSNGTPVSYPRCNFQFRDYQNETIIKATFAKSGIIQSATGSGKTVMMAGIIESIGCRAVVIVHTLDLLKQVMDTLHAAFGIEIGQIGGGIVNLQDITVATVQTLSQCLSKSFYEKYAFDEEGHGYEDKMDIKQHKKDILNWSHTVGLVLFDETQRVGSSTAFGARQMFKNASRAYGLSASPWRDDGGSMMIRAAFGEIIVFNTASDLIRDGWLMQPTIKIIDVIDNIWSGRTYAQVYKSAIVENNSRNMQVVNEALRHHANGLNTLVLITQIKHGEILQKMFKAFGIDALMISGKSGKKHREQTIQDMRDGKAPLVIASSIADVGLDVPRLEAVVEAGAGKSSTTALQRIGRIMRLHDDKTEAIFSTFRDNAPFINKHINNKIKIWKTEPEFKFEEVK